MPLCVVSFSERARCRLCLVLAALNWLNISGSLAIFAVGMYIKTSVEQFTQMVAGYNGQLIPVLLVGVGAAAAVVNGLGGLVIFATMNPLTRERNQCALLSFVIFSFFVSVALVAVSVMCIIQVHQMKRGMSEGFMPAMSNYKEHNEVKETIDRMQTDYQCCGNEDYRDWFKVPWIDDRAAAAAVKTKDMGPRSPRDVPYSCCNPSASKPCIHHDVDDNLQNVGKDFNVQTTINTGGCKDAIVNFFEKDLMGNGGAIIIAVTVIQIAVTLLARLLQTSVYNALRRNDPMSRSTGYLCGCGGDSRGFEQLRGDENQDEMGGPMMNPGMGGMGHGGGAWY